ncbi:MULTISPECIES: B12-binding domain-containing radical SAM protein [unclassified Leptolyngbya]|uniref:B12-binding domain-containing radical SAM protein n=1 Tax=unclassified Leptolyngbya TaxID=2650499 RepID=UPI001686CF30|nr:MULTISPECIES: B12-binding domain-containing radical SAM protein [unclassified Leptolyngbya]MBD1912065.1 B12-binding domain-containing radical SAM protein [Leptolyngbya sp. FACHB-8]MBD2156563.1 B12-binding domain-containing radical SAM protein [Leptolyngbya sp. FACHB-16]
MRVLLLYPLFPKSFWSFDKTLELIGRKVSLPPLSLTTVAAILPQSWEFRLVDRNVKYETGADWSWADLVIISGMIVQKEDMVFLIELAKRKRKPVAVGGPYVTSVPEVAQEAGADFLVLDEGEITLPLFVEALERGETSGIFRSNGEKPDVTTTPIPRFDLLDLNAYSDMSVQFSRGCPYQCEFCDIIVLYGRKPRTKTPAQLLAELQALYDLGWRRSVFVVDDNFIGNKRNVKLLLQELIPWMEERDYPFTFVTEASVDLAQDQELLDLMVTANFNAVFLGIETPDTDSLSLTQKFQNTRNPLVEAVQTINQAGLRVMAGFIIGFDGEKSGAGDRIIDFVETTAIPQAFFSMLQALPNTALSERLQKEGRLLSDKEEANIHQTTLINFVPTRPVEEIAEEYARCFWELYDPHRYLARVYRHFINMKVESRKKKVPLPEFADLRAIALICWRQGLKRNTRWQFWQQLFSILRQNPSAFEYYLTNCAHLEHFLDYRQIVLREIEAQLANYEPIEPEVEAVEVPASR